MHVLRKQDLSIYYFLKDVVFSGYAFVNVADGYPGADLTPPTVSIEAYDVELTPYELGNRVGLRDRAWVIDVFATNKAQRDEFQFLVLDELENGIPVYDYDEGFPPSVTPSKIGTLEPINIRSSIVTIFPEIQEKIYWRASISFLTDYHPI